MTKTAEWNEIMNGLRGLRLAVHCDLSDGNANMVKLDDLKTQDALGWLVYHRLVWKDGERFVARMPREAAAMWREHGPAREEAGRLFPASAVERIDYNAEMRAAAAAAQPIPPEIRSKMDADRAAAQSARPAAAIEKAGLPAAALPHRQRPAQEELFK